RAANGKEGQSGQGGRGVQRGQGVRADVILISAQAERDYADLIAESPAAGFLHKPELSAQRISQLLNRQLRVGQPGFQLAGTAIGRLPGRRFACRVPGPPLTKGERAISPLRWEA